MTLKISSLEYKLRQILNGYGEDDLTKGFSPRSLQEEEQNANDSLREQLSTFKHANGTSLDSDFVDSMTNKPH